MHIIATTPLESLAREKTIGIVGGGQLGRMLAMAAGRLGFNTIILDPTPSCPAVQFANAQIVCGYENQAGLNELAKHSFCITYEFENVPVSGVRSIEKSCRVLPGSNALEISQDRLAEKRFFNKFGIETAPFEAPQNPKQLKTLLQGKFGEGAILKTRRMGYDGKGQIRVGRNTNVSDPALTDLLAHECILEGLVNFDCEISVIAARDATGENKTYDCALNVHKNGILATSTIPSGLPRRTEDKAKEIATNILNKFQYVGVLAVEFFVCGETLLVNEFAPRVHNSGHWTEAACTISQFELHIRAISGLPLADTHRHSDCKMHNLLGRDIERIAELAKLKNVFLHDYGKSEVKPGRKMGHFTEISPLS